MIDAHAEEQHRHRGGMVAAYRHKEGIERHEHEQRGEKPQMGRGMPCKPVEALGIVRERQGHGGLGPGASQELEQIVEGDEEDKGDGYAPQLVGIECPGGPLAAYAAQVEQPARGEDEEGHAYGSENGGQGGAEAMVLAGGHVDQLHMKHHHQHDAQPAHQAQPLQSFRRMVARRHRHLSLRWLSCTRCPCCRRQWQSAPYTLRSPRGDP